jgi:hypothetical protein
LVRNKQQAEDLGALAKTQTMQAAMEAAAAARAALLQSALNLQGLELLARATVAAVLLTRIRQQLRGRVAVAVAKMLQAKMQAAW